MRVELIFDTDHTLTYRLNDSNATQRWLGLNVGNGIAKRRTRCLNWWGHECYTKALSDLIEEINSTCPTILNHGTRSKYSSQELNYLHAVMVEKSAVITDRRTSHLLSELNETIHAVEGERRVPYPTMVNSVLSFAAREPFTDSDLRSLSVEGDFGDLYINYAFLGKSFAMLAKNDETYFDQFAPYTDFDASCVIKFFDGLPGIEQRELNRCERYFDQHRAYFESLGYSSHLDPSLRPGLFKLGSLERAEQLRESIPSLEGSKLIDVIPY